MFFLYKSLSPWLQSISGGFVSTPRTVKSNVHEINAVIHAGLGVLFKIRQAPGVTFFEKRVEGLRGFPYQGFEK